MASDTDSAKNEEARPRPDLVGTLDARSPHPGGERADARRWSRSRILYLDSYPQPAGEGADAQGRGRSDAWRRQRCRGAGRTARKRLLANCRAVRTEAGFGSIGADGELQLDSWRLTGPTYRLRDPATQKWTKDVARALDRGFNALVGEETDEDFVEPADRPAPGLAGSRRKRAGSGATETRNPPGARTDPGLLRARPRSPAVRPCWSPTMTAPSPAPCASSAGRC